MGELYAHNPAASVTNRRRWCMLLVAWLAFLLSFADRLAFSTMSIEVAHSLGLSSAALGTFVTAFYVGYVASNVLAGLGSDWLGPRLMLSASLCCLGGATWLFGSTSSAAGGLAVQAVMGLSAGVDYVAGVKLITTWFGPRERGRAMGVFMTATSLAVVLTNLVVPQLRPALGWGGVYHLLGGITVVVAGLAWLTIVGGPGPMLLPGSRPQYRLLLRNRQVVLLGLAGFGALWGTWGFAFWASALMRQRYHLSLVEAGFVVALFGVGAIPAKPCIGLLSDWLGGRRRALTTACLVYFAATLMIFASLGSLTAFEAMAPLLGIGAFAYSPLMNLMVAEAAGVALAGSAAGVTNAFWGLGNVLAPSLVGVVFQATHSFPMAFAVLAAGPIVGVVCTAMARETTADGSKQALRVA